MAKRVEGKVVSVSMKDTIVVRVESRKQHPLYKKIVKRHKNFFAHVDKTQLEKLTIGSTVSIVETKPVSRHTHFAVEKIITKK